MNYIIYFIVSGLSNITPVILAKLFPNLDYPLDFGLRIGNIRILGKNKTVRGFIGGIMVGFLSLVIINKFYYLDSDYMFFLLIPIFTLLGDCVKSFVKRRFGIKEGDSFFPFDQIDWVLGLLLLLYIYGYNNYYYYIVLLTLGLILHIAFKYLSYILKLEKKYI